VSLNLILNKNDKVGYDIRIQTHKSIISKFWIKVTTILYVLVIYK